MTAPPSPPVRLSPGASELPATHALMTRAFAYMDGRVDPPSSIHRLTLEALTGEAAQNELWILPGPQACVILTPKSDHLYIGKLAVAEAARGQGLSRILIDHAATRARDLGLPRLRLQTRVELTGNQRAFMAMGFAEVGRTAHDGYDRPTSITYERAV